MESQITTSDLAIRNNNYTDTAWHFVSVLLSIGRPASTSELAAKSTLFRASPDFIWFLCFIPNSPLFLTPNGLVLPSDRVFRVFGEFFASLIPKVPIRVFGAPTLFNWSRMKFGSEVVPLEKKLTVLKSVQGNERKMERFGAVDRTVPSPKALPIDITQGGALGNVSDKAVTRSMAISNNGALEYQPKYNVLKKYVRKRKNIGSEIVPLVKKRVHLSSFEGNAREESFASNDKTVLALKAPQADMPREVALGNFGNQAVTSSMVISETRLLEYQSVNDDFKGSGNKQKALQDDVHNNLVVERTQDDYYNDNEIVLKLPEVKGEGCEHFLFDSLAEISAFLEVDEPEPVDLEAKMDAIASSCINLNKHDKNTSVKAPISHKDVTNMQVPETKIKDMVELPLEDHVFPDITADKKKNFLGLCGVDSYFEDIPCHTTMENSLSKQPTLREDVGNNETSNQVLVPAKPQSGNQKNIHQPYPIPKQKAPSKLQQDSKADILRKKTKSQKDQNTIAVRDNAKDVARNSTAAQEKCANKSLKDQQTFNYPEFESYTVEEEEGSGGYGTVYRARRKTDGVTFAIKCPHAKAHVHHLKNEQKMLQRFGGRHFVIKYEGSLKSRNGDCFVLEHVEHDRPEALRREINIYQLQWYGFCLFKALSSLHKQGVFHRDVKPGNFLFSSKSNKGYLIDFNLAKDLHQKAGNLDTRSEPRYLRAAEHLPAPNQTYATPTKRRKILSGKPSDAIKAGATSGANHTQESKTIKSKAMDRLTSQGADGSGLTSKDMTSTRALKERLKEPIPCQGRKELINLAQKAMQLPNLRTGSAPVSKRKRVSASPVVEEQNFIYLTPTPLHSYGNFVHGAASLKNKGDTKSLKEGSCVGTKGFRAPEVLIRSLYQGPKIDVWSAGVTLLYLITGKMPFTGDPEQNMKDIVKLKGNEDLWEVAKLHNRESSIPMELLDVKFIQSTTIKEWCIANTKRIQFLCAIPDSLFDLVEKCLVVNPRLRITAEEALRHEFFAPCHDALQSAKSARLISKSADMILQVLPSAAS